MAGSATQRNQFVDLFAWTGPDGHPQWVYLELDLVLACEADLGCRTYQDCLVAFLDDALDRRADLLAGGQTGSNLLGGDDPPPIPAQHYADDEPRRIPRRGHDYPGPCSAG